MSERAASTDPTVAAGWLTAIDRSQFVLELEPDGTIVRANALLCAALGYDVADLVGRRHRDLFAPDTPAQSSAGEPHRTISYRAKDGRQVVVRASAIPIMGDEGRPVRSLVIGIDVSDRDELRAALAERDRSRVRPGGAPATGRGSGSRRDAAAVLDGRLAPNCSGRTLAAIEAGRMMLDLLEKALADGAGALDADHVATVPAPVDIAAHVRACADTLRPAAEDKGLVLRCEIDPDLPGLVRSDPARLRQVLLHLIGDAVQFTDKGWISVCAEPAWDDPATLAISVADTGTGMACDAAGAAGGGAGPGEADGAVPQAGRGLGLAISAEIARQMGGTLSLSSERSRGNRAELRVPLRPSGVPRDRRVRHFRFPD